ncbi:MAG: class I SAM-dependent methyltransferase [Roseivirga sp.]|nr:class I SAM-dependent methyltransferase [Roseivirga sp.]
MSCVACGSSNITLAYKARDIHEKSFTHFRCQSCNTVQIEHFDSALLAYAYDTGYYGGTDTKFKWPFSTLFDLGKKLAAKHTATLINDSETDILDIGCGKGDFLEKLHGLGHSRLWGNDIEKPQQLPAYIHWLPGSFPDIQEVGQQFDLITLTHVFEHLQEPVKVISKLNDLLKPNGRILLSQPNIDSLQAEKYQNFWLHLDPPRHLHLIPPAQLKKMFAEAGFQLESEKYDSPLYNPFGYLQSWLNKRITQRDLLYEFLKKGGRIKNLKGFFQLIFSFLFAGLSFPFYFLLDRSESKKGKSGTMELVFRKK